MKKLTLIFSILVLCNFYFSQYRTDFGVNIGGANYLGEIGGDSETRRDFIFDMKMNETKMSYGAFLRHQINMSYAITTTLTFAQIAGSDANTMNAARKERNLSFSNNISEISTRLDYYFYAIHDVGNHGRYWVNFKPYVFIGLGIFHHNPKAKLNEKWHELRPLKTEGQVNEYAKFNLSIPAGLGFYFTLKNKYRLSVEMAYRKTFTDYLDDVSGVYADPDKVSSDLSAELANRNDELNNSEKEIDPANYLTGSKRGDDTNKDSFLTSHVTLSYVMRGNHQVKVLTRGPYRPRLRVYRYKF